MQNLNWDRMPACNLVLAVTEASQIGEARREAARLAREAGLSEVGIGNVSIAVSELATNLVRYAINGEIFLRAERVPSPVMHIHSIDRGPGMADVGRCIADGYSTGSTPGNGLGAVQRLSQVFDIHSAQPSGTVTYSRVGDRPLDAAVPGVGNRFDWGVLARAAPYETVCGDSWEIVEAGGELAILVADGLGHGPEAHAAAITAEAIFREYSSIPLTKLFDVIHTRMRGTRGAALAVASLNAAKMSMNYVGVGNISGILLGSVEGKWAGRGLFSHNGTVGVQVRKVQEFVYPFAFGSLLVMHSDGLQSRWSLTNYPGLEHRHPAVIAGVLLRDFLRGRDDCTVAVVRTPRKESASYA